LRGVSGMSFPAKLFMKHSNLKSSTKDDIGVLKNRATTIYKQSAKQCHGVSFIRIFTLQERFVKVTVLTG